MATAAEVKGIQSVAKSMSTKDLKWQIANAAKLRIPRDLNELFRAELSTRADK